MFDERSFFFYFFAITSFVLNGINCSKENFEVTDRACTPYIANRNKTIETLNEHMGHKNASDIIEIRFLPRNVPMTSSNVSISYTNFKYQLFIFFLVTKQGKSILKYPADVGSILTLYTLGSKKTNVAVDLVWENSTDCQFTLESLRTETQNVAWNLRNDVNQSKEIHMCNYRFESEIRSEISAMEYILPYYTWNTFETVCYNGDSEEKVPRAFVCYVIFVLTCIIYVTFPLVAIALPSTVRNNVEEYQDYETPYSFRRVWHVILYKYDFKIRQKSESEIKERHGYDSIETTQDDTNLIPYTEGNGEINELKKPAEKQNMLTLIDQITNIFWFIPLNTENPNVETNPTEKPKKWTNLQLQIINEGLWFYFHPKNFLRFINSTCRKILIVIWISYLFNTMIHVIKSKENPDENNLEKQSRSSALTQTINTMTFYSLILLTIVVLEVSFRNFFYQLQDTESRSDPEPPDNYNKETELVGNNTKNTAGQFYLNYSIFNIYVFECVLCKTCDNCYCGCWPFKIVTLLHDDKDSEYGSAEKHFHYKCLKMIENSLLSVQYWIELIKISSFHRTCIACCNKDESQTPNTGKYISIKSKLKKIFVFVFLIARVLTNLIIFLLSLSFKLLISSPVLIVNIIFVVWQNIPILNVCTKTAYIYLKTKTCGEIILLISLYVIVCIPIILDFVLIINLTCIASIEFIIEMLILTVFVGIPFYTQILLPKLALGIALLKMLTGTWLNFQEEMKIILKTITDQTKDLNPNHPALHTSVFSYVYRHAVSAFGSKLLLLTKMCLTICMVYVAYIAFLENDKIQQKDWGQTLSAVFIFFTPDIFDKLFGANKQTKEGQISHEVQVFLENKKNETKVKHLFKRYCENPSEQELVDIEEHSV